MNRNKNFGLMVMREITAYFYYFLISSLLFFVSIGLPGAWLIFFESGLVNIVVIGFMFPGLAALVSCGMKYKESKDKIAFSTLKTFIEGYKKNFKDTIKYSFAYAGIILVIMFNITYYDGEMPVFMMIALVVLTMLSTLIVTYMMIVAAKFQFKIKDLFRVSLYCILVHFKTTVKITMLYVALSFIFPWLGIASTLLFISPIIYFLIHVAYPVLEDVYELFIEKPE